jgi:hypothetical protein
MQDLRYDRLYRTPSSEGYLVSEGEQPLARLELHFGHSAVYGLLLFEHEPEEGEIRELIAHVDEDLVWTANVARDDFVVSVYTGRELGVFDDAARGEGGDGASDGGDGGR